MRKDGIQTRKRKPKQPIKPLPASAVPANPGKDGRKLYKYSTTEYIFKNRCLVVNLDLKGCNVSCFRFEVEEWARPDISRSDRGQQPLHGRGSGQGLPHLHPWRWPRALLTPHPRVQPLLQHLQQLQPQLGCQILHTPPVSGHVCSRAERARNRKQPGWRACVSHRKRLDEEQRRGRRSMLTA